MPHTVQDERQRLQRRLAELDEERGHIRYALDILNRLAGTTETEPESRSDTSNVSSRTDTSKVSSRTDTSSVGARLPGTREQAVQAILTIGRPVKVEEIVAVMRTEGWQREVENPTETVRAALSRAARDGEIARTGFGLYGPPGSESRSESEEQVMAESHSSLNGDEQ